MAYIQILNYSNPVNIKVRTYNDVAHTAIVIVSNPQGVGVWNSGTFYLDTDVWYPLTIGATLEANVTYTIRLWDYYAWTHASSSGVLASTTIRLDGSGGGSGSAGGDVWYLGTGDAGYPSITDGVGPYPIDGTNYIGQRGTKIKIGWDSTSNYGWYWAKINGTGNKLYTNNASDIYDGTYDAAHHGTGEYASITLEGDAEFANCSSVNWSLSALSTDATNWGSWDPNASAATQSTYGTWSPPRHFFGSSHGNWQEGASDAIGVVKRLNPHATSNAGGYRIGPASGYTNEHAVSGEGRGSQTVIIARGTTDQVVTYYCKQSMGDGAYASNNGGAKAWEAIHGKGSVAAISFLVPKLDPLISISSDSALGSAYALIATSGMIDETTGETTYTYDATHHSSRYIPAGSHIKFVAVTEEVFNGFGAGIQYVDEGNGTYSYELDVTEDVSLTASFSEDLSSKASYLYEPVTDTNYQLKDSETVVNDSMAHYSNNVWNLNQWSSTPHHIVYTDNWISYTTIPPNGTSTQNWQEWFDEGVIADYGEIVIAPNNKTYGSISEIGAWGNKVYKDSGYYNSRVEITGTAGRDNYTLTVKGTVWFENLYGYNGSSYSLSCSDTSLMSTQSASNMNIYPSGGGNYGTPDEGHGTKTVTDIICPRTNSSYTLTFTYWANIGGSGNATGTATITIPALEDQYMYYVDETSDTAKPLKIWVKDGSTWKETKFCVKNKDGTWVKSSYY